MNSKPIFLFLSFFLAIALVLSAGNAQAQEEATDARLEEARELLEQFLPDGVTVDTAEERQLVEAVTAAVEDSPWLADAIAIVAINAGPDWTYDIVCRAVRAAPEETDVIVSACIGFHPLLAETIMASAIECAPPGAVIAEDVDSLFDTLGLSEPPSYPENPTPTTI